MEARSGPNNQMQKTGRRAIIQCAGGSLRNEMKVSEILKAIKNNGCFQVTQRESHRQFKHPSKPGRVTIAGKPSDELAKGTQMSILKQAGLRGSEQP